MNHPEDLIGTGTAAPVELAELVRIAGAHGRSSAPHMDALLKGAGEFDGTESLVIYSSPTSSGTMLDRCSAFCRAMLTDRGQAAPDVWSRAVLEDLRWLAPASKGWKRKRRPVDRKLLDWTGADVGRALWSLAAFEEMSWDWDRSTRRERGGIWEGQGSTTESRIATRLEWDYGRREVDAAAARIGKDLIRLPMPPEGISRKRFEGLVYGDLAQLKSLCGKAGVVAHGLLKSPYARVERCLTLRSNAAETLVCLETRSAWFGIRRRA